MYFAHSLKKLLTLLCVGAIAVACSESPPADTPAEDTVTENGSPVTFTEVTAAAGLDVFEHKTGAFGNKWFPETMGSGAAFFDYNGDGWEDIVLVGGGTWSEHTGDSARALWLYRNDGDGTFTDVTRQAGLHDVSAYGFGVAAADYDNDGEQDLFFSTLRENMLFRNDDGTFTAVGSQAGIAGHAAWSSSAIFFDANKDGWLDLYVGNYVEWSPENDIPCLIAGEKGYCTPEEYEGVPGRFYQNNGDGTFTDRTEEAGFLPSPGKTLGVAELDFNRDGWPDLVVTNDLARDLLYENTGEGIFEEKGIYSGIAFDENGRARAGMGVDTGVVDTTGEVSIFVGNFTDEMIGVYRYTGHGLFQDRAAVSKVGRPTLPTLTFGLFLFDVEFDRDLDLFAANGHVQADVGEVRDGITYRQPPQLFLNDGNGRFEETDGDLGGILSEPIVGRGAAYADYDHDGDLDVLLTENGGPVHLWRNDLEGAHFLRVGLRGQQSNRDGLGSRVILLAGGEHQERRVRTGSSYLSQSETTVTFGLGDIDRIDSLEVHWPSGRIDRFSGLDTGQQLLVTEGETARERSSTVMSTTE
jgi:hypothetical protein